MSSKQLRGALRITHLVLGAMIGLFIYVPLLRGEPAYATLIQFVVIPVIALSGIAMWQLPKINKWRNRSAREA